MRTYENEVARVTNRLWWSRLEHVPWAGDYRPLISTKMPLQFRDWAVSSPLVRLFFYNQMGEWTSTLTLPSRNISFSLNYRLTFLNQFHFYLQLTHHLAFCTSLLLSYLVTFLVLLSTFILTHLHCVWPDTLNYLVRPNTLNYLFVSMGSSFEIWLVLKYTVQA